MFSKSVQRIVFSALVSIAFCALPAAASSSVPGPTVTIGITDGLNPKLIIDTAFLDKQPSFVAGQAVWTTSLAGTPWVSGADIYFGVILPGGTSIQTWSPDSNGAVTLKNGYAPLVSGRSVVDPSTFTTASANGGKEINYTFSGGEPKGLYMVVFFLVAAGKNPADVTNWNSVTMQPLFVM